MFKWGELMKTENTSNFGTIIASFLAASCCIGPGIKEKKAWLTLDELLADEMLAKAVQKAGPYIGKIVDLKLDN